MNEEPLTKARGSIGSNTECYFRVKLVLVTKAPAS